MQSSMNQEQLKDVIKTALIEVLEERQDLLHEAIEVALEDIALARAIKEGAKTKPVRREEVFKILEGKAWRLDSKPASRNTSAKSRTKQRSNGSKPQLRTLRALKTSKTYQA
jgi:hypothetical protein